jgi:hypothetical protein
MGGQAGRPSSRTGTRAARPARRCGTGSADRTPRMPPCRALADARQGPGRAGTGATRPARPGASAGPGAARQTSGTATPDQDPSATAPECTAAARSRRPVNRPGHAGSYLARCTGISATTRPYPPPDPRLLKAAAARAGVHAAADTAGLLIPATGPAEQATAGAGGPARSRLRAAAALVILAQRR